MGWLAVVAGGSAAVWLVLLLGHGWFWRTDVRLPDAAPPQRWPSVAAVVPARDEADVVPVTLPTLCAQDVPNIRIILVDDRSGDGTAEVVRELGGDRVQLVPGAGPPPGWAGKVWAMQQGVEAAGDVDFVLFTDADITHPPDSVRRLVAFAESGGLDLVSLMARLRVRSRWERVVVPAFVYFFAQLYPFRRVNRDSARTAAAAGGCVLVRRTALERAGGVRAIHAALIDDVALARAVKRSGGRIWLGLADEVRSMRPYPQLADLWRMVSRSAYTQLRHSPALLAGTVLGLLWLYAVPPVATVAGALTGDVAVLLPAVVAWLLMTASYVPMLRYYGVGSAAAPLLPLTALLYAAMTVDSARRHHQGRGGAWKGRTYAPGS